MKLSFRNIASLMRPRVHGYHRKTLVVLHETVSGDASGWSDIEGPAEYLVRQGYGIHGLTDKEGNIAWAAGLGQAILWHAAGGVNTIAIGIEQVSRVMLESPSNTVRRKIWVARNKQLRATAKLLACISRAHGIPLRYVGGSGDSAGVTSHWDVSVANHVPGGHTDCWPVKKGGYYPMLEVIQLARMYKAAGWRF